MAILQWTIDFECLNPPEGYRVSLVRYPFTIDTYGYVVETAPPYHTDDSIYLSRCHTTAAACKAQCERDLIALGILKGDECTGI